MYPYSPIPLIPTQFPHNTKSSPTYPWPHTHLSPHPLSIPRPNSHPTYLPYIHPTQLYSRANSTPTNPTRPPTISTTFRTLSHPRRTLAPANQTPSHTSAQPIYPTIPTPHSIVPAKLSLLLPLYAQYAAKTRISPTCSNAHMSLGRFCCALTIEYKCKPSNINKCL